MTTISIGRQVITPLARPGLTPEQEIDARYMATGNAWLDCAFVAGEIAKLDAKRTKLAALLDDPGLLLTHPRGDPERGEAEAKHTHLSLRRRRLIDELRTAAKRLDRTWGQLSPADQQEFICTIGEGWRDVAVIELARMDRHICLRPVWRALYAAWDAPRQEGLFNEPCPF